MTLTPTPTPTSTLTSKSTPTPTPTPVPTMTKTEPKLTQKSGREKEKDFMNYRQNILYSPFKGVFNRKFLSPVYWLGYKNICSGIFFVLITLLSKSEICNPRNALAPASLPNLIDIIFYSFFSTSYNIGFITDHMVITGYEYQH
jgi:hypothetical protein